MTTLAVRPVSYPEAPVAEKPEGTLLDVISFTEAVDGQSWLDGAGLFASYNCLTSGTVLGETCGPVSASKFAGAEGPTWVDGFKFASYGAVVCKLEDPAQLEAGVQRAFLAAESRGIEAGLMEHVFVANPDGGVVPGGWDAAEDITPAAFAGVGMDPVLGLGLLESHMGRNYAGKGVIHVPRLVGTALAHEGAIDWEGGKLVTSMRTPVAAGTGYDLPNTGPTGTEAPAGTKWIYGTGAIVAIRQSLKTRSAFNIYGQQADAEAPNFVDGLDPNDQIGLAEGVYLIAVDCYKAAVLVKLYEEA